VEPKPTVFEVRPNPELRAMKDDVRAPGTAKLIDFRAAEEFEAGHIPGAVHFSWKNLVAADRPLPAEEVSPRLQSAGITPQASVIAYCQSGMRAALGYLQLSQMGMKVRLYDGSYNDWSK
jgi:thiosulfate/3-mercaptopyruvate sulfurtransferase